MVKVDDGSVISDNVLSSSTVNLSIEYILVDCVDGICKQTQGYVVDGIKKGIVFKGSSNGVATASNGIYESNVCVSGEDGMIISGNSGVCIKGAAAPASPVIANFVESEIRKHIIENAVNTTPFYSEVSTMVPIKHGINYAIVDMFESGNKYII